MDEATYYRLFEMVAPLIQKEDTMMRKAISAHERLAATLRFLATGRSFEDLKFITCNHWEELSRLVAQVDVLFAIRA